MEDEKLISIIVPVYKVEKYIRKCINSIINQTYKNIEVILVDDGSPDECGKICDEYKEKDNRIKVIHKKNGGLSDARNAGLDICNGEFVCFIDSDDYVLENYIEYLYMILKENNANISCCNFEYIYDNKIVKEFKNDKEKIHNYDKINALMELLYQKNIDTSMWAKLFDIKLFDNIRFPYGKIYEDFAVFYKLLLKTNKLVYSNQKKYLYLQREESILSTPFSDRDLYMITIIKEMYNEIIINYPELQDALNSRILNMDFYLIRRMNKREYRKEYKDLVNDIKSRRSNVRKDKKIKLKTKIAIYISYFNIDLVTIFYNLAKGTKMFGINKYLTKYKR